MNAPFKTREHAAGWLAAIIDGEGYVGFALRPIGTRRIVKIANTDPSILAAVYEALDLFGIQYTEVERAQPNPKWKRITEVIIQGRRNLEKMAASVELRADKKHIALTSAVSTYKGHRFNRDELHRLYVVERHSQATIAKMLGCSQANIQYAIRRAGLQIPESESKRRGWTDDRRVRQAASMAAHWRLRKGDCDS
jgi:hypothetical protein